MFPSHPLLRRFERTFEFRWPTTGEEISIEWASEEGDLFFRPRDADASILWHALDLFGKRAPEVVLDEALKAKQLRRVLPFSEREFVLWNQREGIFWTQGNDVGAAFSLPECALSGKGRAFFWKPCEEFAHYLRSVEMPPTDFQRARLFFAKQDSGEWLSLETGYDCGIPLHDVLRAIVTMYTSLGTLPNNRCQIMFDSNQNLVLRDCKEVPLLLMETVNRCFLPVQKQRRRVRGFSSWNIGFEARLFIASEPSSAHERLEAMLFLRDFLQDKLPSSTIETLLKV